MWAALAVFAFRRWRTHGTAGIGLIAGIFVFGILTPSCTPPLPPPTLDLPPDPLFGVVAGRASADAERIIVAVDGEEIAGGPGPALDFAFDSLDVDDGAHLVRATSYVGEQSSDAWLLVDVRQAAGDREPPRVRFLEPAEGEVIAEGDPYIVLDIGDDVGVAHVDVRHDDVLLGVLPPEGPWELRWQDAPEGRLRLVASVSDVAGKRTTAEVRIVVGALPTP